ncbi:MAG: DUF2807 domain-containing protein [Oscillospiraceae bacterium]|nr:DUF2807 domain-containing protein [Oscillospiraceae bacterium]
MKKQFIVLMMCVILAMLNLTGCVIVGFTSRDLVTAKGEREVYETSVDEYNKIRVEGYCEINYYSSPSDTITLEVQSNIREYYTIEVVNGELIVRAEKRINFNSAKIPVLSVYAPDLEQINLSGAGTLKTHDPIVADSFKLIISGAADGNVELDADNLSVTVSGAGNFTLSGRADTAYINMSGAGKLNALELQTLESEINLSGAGTIQINCTEKLKINAGGVGSIEYSGSPEIDLNTGGVVSIRKID